MIKVDTKFVIIGIIFMILIANVNARNNFCNKISAMEGISSTKQVSTERTLSNINNFSSWIYWNGQSGIQPNGSSGGIYPRGTAGVIFQDGFVWGGVLRGVATEDQRIRVGGQTYFIGTVPGYIDESGNPVNSSEDSRIRIYRIRKDYLTASDSELALDASEVMQIPIGSIEASHIQEIRDQYTTDWDEWPVELGAPFNDLNNNGIYEPEMDETPGVVDADQVIWFVTHDLDPAVTLSMYGSLPIGLEAQYTIWAYNA